MSIPSDAPAHSPPPTPGHDATRPSEYVEVRSQPPADPLDLREGPRVGLVLPARIHSAAMRGRPLSGMLRDLGAGGACFASASPFAIADITRIEVHLPDGALALPCRGEWQREEAGSDRVLTGVAFDRPSREIEQRLWALVLSRGQELARFFLDHHGAGGLGLDEALGLAQLTRLRQVQRGAALYRQDTPNPSAFFVLTGSFALQVRARESFEVEIGRAEVGALLGGASLLTGRPPDESALALCDSEVLEIDESAYAYLRQTRPWLAQRLGTAILEAGALRLGSAIRRVADRL